MAAEVAAHTKVLCLDELHVTDVADAMILSRSGGDTQRGSDLLGHCVCISLPRCDGLRKMCVCLSCVSFREACRDPPCRAGIPHACRGGIPHGCTTDSPSTLRLLEGILHFGTLVVFTSNRPPKDLYKVIY